MWSVVILDYDGTMAVGALDSRVNLTGLFINTGPLVEVATRFDGSHDAGRTTDPFITYDGGPV